jgi:malic enzyme
MPQVMRNAAPADVRLIVVTDNERILGLGDQGAGGMGIPIGKLAIYSAAAGIHPASTLPVSLDVGTDNAGLLADPLYLGHRANRMRGAEYDRFVERFVEAVLSTFPRAVLQWEDFKGHIALETLGRYRHRLASFNDDIQGTGATVLGGVLAASRLLALPVDRLRFMVVGAGAAGIGIGRMLSQALTEAGGRTREALVMVDREGIIHSARVLSSEKAEFAVDPALLPAELVAAGPHAELADVVEAWRPHILIGTTAVQGRFDEATIRAMARVTPRPVVMALSNPITACEVLPTDVMAWSEGRALMATGSPFESVMVDGTRRLVGQGNNAFIFPGLGLGAIVAEAREVTDGMLLAGARTLADAVTPDRLRAGALYPPIDDLPALARTIAAAVVREARDSGFGRYLPDDEIPAAVTMASWRPEYERWTPSSVPTSRPAARTQGG